MCPFSAYSAYLEFFDGQLKKLDFDDLALKYIPILLPGSIGAAGHPVIHLGFAIEFHDSTVLVEALALASTRYLAFGSVIDTPTYGSDTLIRFNDIFCEIANDSRLELTVTADTKFSKKFEQLTEKKDLVIDYFNKAVITKGQ